tara:strand:+ start:12511 stop:13641 length:1131 start_codon:yes stop_codon:yes gene_type:complete
MKNFTSESVTEGHPDKLADKISDSFLDLTLSLAGDKKDVKAAIETMLTGSKVVVAGEISRHLVDDVKKQSEKIVHNVLNEVGYTKDSLQKNIIDIEIVDELKPQSSELARAHEESDDGSELSGDQGMMHGFACLQTPVLMPAAISWAHDLAKRLTEVRKNKTLPYLRPDGKSQVTVSYRNKKPFVHSVVLSTQHDESVSLGDLREDLKEKVVVDVLGDFLTNQSKFYIQTSGTWHEGGPIVDTGLTGRKITVDTYGGYIPNGGGAFSGKDPSKVDRSGAYYARFAAIQALKEFKNQGVSEVEIQVAYAIHKPTPISVDVKTDRSDLDPEIEDYVKSLRWDLAYINQKLDLWNCRYEPLSSYGHFGREDLNLSWEDY